MSSFSKLSKLQEAKKTCFKILAKTPEGDIKNLVTKLQSIEAYTDKEFSTVKPVVIREACGTCNFKGHATKDCWGKCTHCQRFRHQSQFCRNRKTDEEIEMAKRAKEERKVEKKDRKRRKTGLWNC